jgi:glycosyltransferase involved in cell wall biosynthesis
MDISKLRITEDKNKTTILALSWRDIESPNKGGAEVQTHAMLSMLPSSKYRILHISALYDNMKEENVIDDIHYYRAGNVFSVIWKAFVFYRHNKDYIDIVIDQCNTHRFFTPFYVPRNKRVFYIHQMTKEIWGINLKKPFSSIGEFAEQYMTRLYKKGYTVTVSESTKRDLMFYGFSEDRILIIPQILRQRPLPQEQMPAKTEFPSFVYVGRFIPYKGIDLAVEAFGIIKQEYVDARMFILGKYDIDYIQDKLVPICNKYGMTIGYDKKEEYDISCEGFVTEEEKIRILGGAYALLFLSIREGWGIPISEAAYVGTPSIVFDSAGLRDAVDFGKAGYITQDKTAESAAKCMKDVIDNKQKYQEMCVAAYDFTKGYLYRDYSNVLMDFLNMIKNS